MSTPEDFVIWVLCTRFYLAYWFATWMAAAKGWLARQALGPRCGVRPKTRKPSWRPAR